MTLEEEFRDFMRKAFPDVEVGSAQWQGTRDGFYGGAIVGRRMSYTQMENCLRVFRDELASRVKGVN